MTTLKNINLRLPVELIDRIELYREAYEAEHGFKPSKTAVFVQAVERLIADAPGEDGRRD